MQHGRRATPACACLCCRTTRARAPPCCTVCSRRAAGFSHALTMDADGQHPAGMIPAVHAGLSAARTRGHGAGPPGVRRQRAAAAGARPAGVQLVDQPGDLGAGIGDSLFGFRVYPMDGCLW